MMNAEYPRRGAMRKESRCPYLIGGRTDGVRHTERQVPDQGRDREREHPAVLQEGVRGLLQQSGRQRFHEEDDGGGHFVISAESFNKN